MKPIDSKGMIVVQSGLSWNYSMPPCSKQAISLLERNTKVVTWLMKPGGTAHDQIPCIRYKDKYYSLSLRMQKAIYRHIRLKKGFQNLESVDGMTKLRIPDVLLKEKMRTQSRFDAMRLSQQQRDNEQEAIEPIMKEKKLISTKAPTPAVPSKEKKKRKKESSHVVAVAAAAEPTAKKPKLSSNVSPSRAQTGEALSLSLSSSTSVVISNKAKRSEKKERIKNTNTIASKMKQVVDKLIQEQRMQEFKPLLTVFLYKSEQSEIISLFLHEIRKENISLFQDKERLLALIMSKYDDFSMAINDRNPYMSSSDCFNMLNFSVG